MNNVLEIKEQYIHTSIIHNPLEPNVSRKTIELIWDNNKKLYDYLCDLPDNIDWIIIYNGKNYTLEETKKVSTLPDTYLVLSPNLAGGGGGSKGSRLLLVAAVVVAAVFIGPAIISAMGSFATSVASAAGTAMGAGAGTAVSVGGTAGGALGSAAVGGGAMAGASSTGYAVAIGSAVKAATATALKVGVSTWATQQILASQTEKNKGLTAANIEAYGNDSTKPTTQEGSMVGVCYGEYRIGGTVIQNKTLNRGDTQDCYVLNAISEGEVESITDIHINQQSVDQYTGVTTEIRYGVDNQKIIPWFDDSYNVQTKSMTLVQDWITTRNSGNIDKFTIDLTFPIGLYGTAQNDSGTKEFPVSVGIEVQYKSRSSTNWKPLLTDVKAKIENIFEIQAGDVYRFNTPEGEYDREYRFDNIIYKDYVVDDDNKIIYFYVKTGTTSESINNFINSLKTNIDGHSAPKFKVGCENYSNGYKTLVFTPTEFNYDFYNWEIQTVGEKCGTAISFKGQNKSVFTFSGFHKNSVRRIIESPLLARDTYDIRLRRTNKEGDPSFNPGVSDQVVWVDTNEILLDDITYNHTALVGLKIEMNGQIPSTPALSALVKGVKVKKYNYDLEEVAYEWTDNPAWIAVDILTNPRYGGGMSVKRLDMPKFIEWAEYCEEEGLTFNGYINSSSNIWDALSLVCVTNHANLIFCGTKITLSIDKKQDPVFLFNNSNIKRDSFSTDWSGVHDRPNAFTLKFNDKRIDYDQNVLRQIDSDLVKTNSQLNETEVTAIGITDEERATKELKRYILRNRYQRQSVTFSSPIEAVGCTIGDVVIVQHDIPQWGYGGKLEAGCTKSIINLDRPVEMEDDKHYCLLVCHDAAKTFEGKVTSIVGRSIFVEGEINSAVQRLIVNGKDYEIYKAIPGTPYAEIVLSEKNVCKVGDIIELWNTDVLEEADVVTNSFASLTTIQLQNEMMFEPQQFSNWLFGYKDAYKKKFKIQSMGGLNTDSIEINGIEYSDKFYDYDSFQEEPNVSMIDVRPRPVSDLRCEETLVRSGSGYTTDLIVSWDTRLANTYYGADIYVRYISDSVFSKIGQAEGGVNFYTIPSVQDGIYLEIKVVSYDGLGRRCGFEESPIIAYTIQGLTKPPATPKNFEIRKTSQGLMLAWDIVNEADVTGYIIKQGTEWASGTMIDENVANNRYTIQYTEAGTKNFMVKAKDTSGNESKEPAYASITLEPPLDPIDFCSVQNNDFIVLKWNNLDETVTKFRIKEGESWGSGTIVADVAGYSHSVPINGYYNRKFWIKSIDQFGVFCTNAVYTSPMAIEHQTKNIIVEYDESGNGFPHPRLNMDLINDDLIVRENTKYGEYNWYVDIEEKLYSRIISEDEVDAIAYSPKWKDFHNRWNSYEAQSPWVVHTSLDNVQIERQMALPSESVSPDIIESFSFFNTVTGDILGTEPIEAMTYRFDNGRFREGIIVDDQGSLGYNIDIPEVFSIKFWARPRDLVSSGYIELVDTETAISLHLFYDADTRAFTLEDSDGEQILVNTDFSKDEPILVCISQSSTTRTLMIGFSKDLKVLYTSKELPPLGSYTQFNFR